ncbi:hypothetical protein [Selenomonas ruminantium]|uniref:Uncharacterized protein n=1 Tax=Selenomonas ruminantium TaxID=971 RepID=A0A1I0YA41_SELRU|nr:hypothetical protein [Selenomonas ruminantium]SFB10144.1 hypothetical protein SAMN05216587_11137 [Selenomonas ruminantium]
MEPKRESTRARCYNFLAMNCDGALKVKANGMFNWKSVYNDCETKIGLLCEILRIDKSSLNYHETVKKYRPDLFEQSFYDDVRKWVK